MMKLLNELFDFFCPRVCTMCGARLHHTEDCLCLSCLRKMPLTHYHLQKDNPVEKRFFAQFPLGRATAYMYYVKGNDATRILHQLKYANHPQVGFHMGRLMALDLQKDGFFQGIDCIIPVPLAKHRLHHRGYNQCEWLAEGVSSVTHIPIEKNLLLRVKDNETQTHYHADERKMNVEGLFQLNKKVVSTARHFLLIDDVVTTGATLIACSVSLANVPEVKISILTLACASDL